MQSLVTSRIDTDLKNRAVEVLQQNGLTTSDAIRQMFEHVVETNSAPFANTNYFNNANGADDKGNAYNRISNDTKKKISRLDSLCVQGYEDATDNDIRSEILKARYGEC